MWELSCSLRELSWYESGADVAGQVCQAELSLRALLSSYRAVSVYRIDLLRIAILSTSVISHQENRQFI